MFNSITLLVAARTESAQRYETSLALSRLFELKIVTTLNEVSAQLKQAVPDALAIDNGLEGTFEFIQQARLHYPRLLIVLVDEDADFALPGQADDVSIDPFTNDDLVRRIKRLMADRQMDTLRADSMPPIREFSKRLRKATGEIGKGHAAVSACRELGYDYVALYRLDSLEPLKVTLRAQDGAQNIHAVAPKQGSDDDLIGWVARAGQSRIASKQDTQTHPLIRKGRFAIGAGIPVGVANRYGVLIVCKEQPNSITQQHVLMLELLCTQLAALIARET
jgi:hypothetical protein